MRKNVIAELYMDQIIEGELCSENDEKFFINYEEK